MAERSVVPWPACSTERGVLFLPFVMGSVIGSLVTPAAGENVRTRLPCWDEDVLSERAGVLMIEKDETPARSSAIRADSLRGEAVLLL